MIFFVNNKTNSIPDSFSEFSQKHWFVFSRLICSPKIKTSYDLKIAFLKRFTSIPFRKLQKLANAWWDPEQQEEFENHISKFTPIFVKLSYFEKKFLVESNPIRVIKFRVPSILRLYPPNDSLSNLRTWEMAFATKYASDFETIFAKHQNTDVASAIGADKELADTLDKLIATIYRPSLPLWSVFFKYGYSPFDRRRKYYDSLTDLYAKKLKSVPLFKKIMILWWFNSAYTRFTASFPLLFSKSDGDSNHDFSWSDMIVSFENSIPGDEEKVANSYAAHFLNRLVQQKKAIEKLNENKP